MEYLLVGQALSGVFAGFRENLGVFLNDQDYTYDFALKRTPEQLLSLDLSKLDLNNPAGDDKDVEEYGKALSKHLYNLRHFNDDVDPLTEGDQLGKDAYNYIFEELTKALKAQRADLLAKAEGAPEEYRAKLMAGVAQLDQAIDVIVPTAQAEFSAKLQGVYDTYINTLNYAYDVVATFMQYAAQINTIEINANSLNGFNNAASGLIGILFNDFVNGATKKFYYELEQNGVQDTGAPAVPEYVLDETAFADPALRAIAVLAVRYELGNSFFAHPNVTGNKQVRDAVLATLKECKEKDILKDYIENHEAEVIGIMMALYDKDSYMKLYESRKKKEGFIDALASLVKKGLLTIEAASNELNISFEDFKEKMKMCI